MNPSVLIIEDEKIVSHAMRDFLGRRGFESAVTGSAEDGLKMLRESQTDLVVLDYHLPGMDGLEALRQIKQITPAPEVVMVTAHGNVKTAVEAMRAGGFEYLIKPVDFEEMAIVLDKAWTRARRDRHSNPSPDDNVT